MRSTRTKLLLAVVVALLTIGPAIVTPAADIPEDRGAAGLSQALKRLDVVGSVLHTGAHPDDENSALLAWLSRGQGVRAAYLSATRGDGGQNLLGTELFEPLGVIRTEELLAARRFDHAQQFFTPNFDFGFSKTAAETMGKWGHDKVLGDYVRVIRQFRPEIIVSRFSGTPRDGHGHHQVAGIITQEAFKAAADPKLYPEYGKPWQAKKLYLNVNTGPGPGQGQGNAAANAANPANPPNPANAAPVVNDTNSIAINVGEFDPALGRFYTEIAAEGRSLHRSQGQGSTRNRGPQTTRLQLLQKSTDVNDLAPLFTGTLYRLPDLAQLDRALGADLNTLEDRITAIRQKMTLARPFAVFPDIIEAFKLFQQIRAKATNEHVQFLLQQKEADFHEAARLAAGLVVDVITSDDTVVPGQEFNMTVSVVNGGPYDFSTVRSTTDLPPGWDAVFDGSTGSLAPGQKYDQKFKVKAAAQNVNFTQPYWLRQSRDGDRFVWPQGSPVSMPFDAPLLVTRTEMPYDGVNIAVSQPAEFRRVDSIYGEIRSLVNTVPALSVGLAPEIAVVPLTGNRKKEFTVTVENQNTAATEADVRLVTPAGWIVTPASQNVKFARSGDKASIQFTVTFPAAAGDFTMQAVARSGNQEFRNGYTAVEYPHIETHNIYSAAESKVEVFDVKSLVTSVGYVDGAGDKVPDAMRQLGINVTMLSPQDLATGDLSRFQTIVLGIRAYAVRDDVKAYNSRLMDYVSRGGTLIVQYNRRGEIRDTQIGPYPFTINDNDRVTNELAPVKILEPANSVFNIPNKISDKDFEGWVQERGTYFLDKWDAKYTPLLQSNDPGEKPLDGGLVVAKYGKGSYVYTGYVFFRELPAGVKGAYRLLANLVSIEN